MESTLVKAGILFIIVAIVLGAFGAHALAEILSEQKLTSFKTGVSYMLFHGLALCVLANIRQISASVKHKVYLGIFTGTTLFSGSIYVLSFSEVIDLGILKSVLGPVTPLGGLVLISTWIFALLGVKQDTRK